MLIVFEGVEGSGKSSQAQILASRIGGRIVKEEVSHKDDLKSIMNKRLRLINDVVNKSLKDDIPIIYDRFFHSTAVYQSYLGGISLALALRMHKEHTYDIKPDMIFYLKVKPSTATRRIALRGRAVDKERNLIFTVEEKVHAYDKAMETFNQGVITINADFNNKFKIAHKIFEEYYGRQTGKISCTE